MKKTLFIFILYNLLVNLNLLAISDESNNKIKSEFDNKINFHPIYFGYWKPSMNNPQDLRKDIKRLKEIFKKSPKTELLIVGHAGRDFKKPYGYKQTLIDLSRRRAEAVKKELVKHGFPADQIKVKGVGYKFAKVKPEKFDKNETLYSQRNQPDRYVKINIDKISTEHNQENRKANILLNKSI